jgi:hypothetical protein
MQRYKTHVHALRRGPSDAGRPSGGQLRIALATFNLSPTIDAQRASLGRCIDAQFGQIPSVSRTCASVPPDPNALEADAEPSYAASSSRNAACHCLILTIQSIGAFVPRRRALWRNTWPIRPPSK